MIINILFGVYFQQNTYQGTTLTEALSFKQELQAVGCGPKDFGQQCLKNFLDTETPVEAFTKINDSLFNTVFEQHCALKNVSAVSHDDGAVEIRGMSKENNNTYRFRFEGFSLKNITAAFRNGYGTAFDFVKSTVQKIIGVFKKEAEEHRRPTLSCKTIVRDNLKLSLARDHRNTLHALSVDLSDKTPSRLSDVLQIGVSESQFSNLPFACDHPFNGDCLGVNTPQGVLLKIGHNGLSYKLLLENTSLPELTSIMSKDEKQYVLSMLAGIKDFLDHEQEKVSVPSLFVSEEKELKRNIDVLKADTVFEITKNSAQVPHICIKEYNSTIADVDLRRGINFDSTFFKVTEDKSTSPVKYLCEYRGIDGTEITFHVLLDASVVISEAHDTGFDFQKTWGFSCPGSLSFGNDSKPTSLSPANFYGLYTRSETFINSGILKTGFFSLCQKRMVNRGIIHSGQALPCNNESQYNGYYHELETALDEGTESFKNIGTILSENDLIFRGGRLKNGQTLTEETALHSKFINMMNSDEDGILSHPSKIQCGGHIIFDDTKVHNEASIITDGGLEGQTAHLENCGRLYFGSISPQFVPQALSNSGNILGYGSSHLHVPGDLTSRSSEIFVDGDLRVHADQYMAEDENTGMFASDAIHVTGTLVSGKPSSKATTPPKKVEDFDRWQAEVQKEIEEAAQKKPTTSFWGAQKKTIDIIKRIHHYINFITQDQFGRTISETGYIYQNTTEQKETKERELTPKEKEELERAATIRKNQAKIKKLHEKIQQVNRDAALRSEALRKSFNEAMEEAGLTQSEKDALLKDPYVAEAYSDILSRNVSEGNVISQSIAQQAQAAATNLWSFALENPDLVLGTIKDVVELIASKGKNKEAATRLGTRALAALGKKPETNFTKIEPAVQKIQAHFKESSKGVSTDSPSVNINRTINTERAHSPVWKQLKHYKNEIKTNGLSGGKRKFYKWDNCHNDIEVYGPGGRKHLGSMNPKTGKMYKPGVPGRTIKREI